MLKVAQIVAAIAVLALFLSVAGIAYLSSPPPGNPSQQQSAAETKNGKQAEEQHAFRGFVRFLFPDSISIFTFWLMLATIILGIVAVVQIGYLRRAENISANTAKAAKDSADAARETLIASQRAWVKVDRVAVTSPLTFKEGSASTAVSIRLVNVGNAPALKVQPTAWLYPLQPGTSPFDEQRRRCDALQKLPFGIGFASIFPGETFPDNLGIGGFAVGIGATPDEIAKALTIAGERKQVSLYVIGCVDYTFPTDPNTHHQTRFAYHLTKNVGGPINPDDGDIPDNGLLLFETGLGRSAD